MVHFHRRKRPGTLGNDRFELFKLYKITISYGQAEFREANFSCGDFCSLNRVSDSVNDAESNDIKIMT